MSVRNHPITPAQRLQRSLGDNPYVLDADTTTTEFAPVSASSPNYPPDPWGADASTGVDYVEQSLSKITVTAMYAATIFEGEDNVYRYDLPLSAIQEGRAVSDVVDQVRAMTVNTWPNVNVLIDAPGQAGPTLLAAFQKSGVTVSYVDGVEPIGSASTGQRPFDSPVYQASAAQSGRERTRSILRPFHMVIMAVVVTVCAISWWAIGKTTVPDTINSLDAQSSEDGFGDIIPPPVDADSSSVVPMPEEDPVEDTVQMVSITQGLTTIELPVGYEVTKVGESGLVTLTGNDPDFRVLMAANPMAEEKLSLANIAQRVANSSTFAARPNESFVGGRNVVSYMENPSDGSTAHWYVWGESGHQMSVGCHWRKSVGPERQEDCETAVRTLKLSAKA